MPVQSMNLGGSRLHGTSIHSEHLRKRFTLGLCFRNHEGGPPVKPPFEFKVMRVRECAVPDRLIDTPESSYQYWITNIPQAGWFDPAKEAFVVLVLNTRRRIIGHNLVALGSLDSIAVHAREVFRPIIVAA